MTELLLRDIVAKLRPLETQNLNLSTGVKKICQTWQEVEPASIFVAVKGSRFDGHDFLAKAKDKGAAAFVVSEKNKAADLPVIVVDSTRKALSSLASLFYQNPSSKMGLIGVTGTNGKTTVNWMIYHLLLGLCSAAFRIGTLGFAAAKSKQKVLSIEGNLTTPDALNLQKNLADCLSSQINYGVIELSSHALDQYRVEDLELDVAVYTNLSRDHLDYHQGMREYFAAKARILDLLEKSTKKKKTAVINIDCEYGKILLQNASKLGLDSLTFGKDKHAFVCICSFEESLSGSVIEFSIGGEQVKIRSPFIGYHNAQNMAAAIASMLALGFKLDGMREILAAIEQVPGRLQSVGNDRLGIFVDYAHTPDALKNVLLALRPLAKGNLWLVIGCGGDRDRGKRPEMAGIGRQFADRLVITSDNPRTEDPEAIIKDMLSEGVQADICEPDRRKAIEGAIRSAALRDIILIAGKGHEDYQIIGTEKRHFSDVEEVKRVLDE